jgi:hypothetical protein
MSQEHESEITTTKGQVMRVPRAVLGALLAVVAVVATLAVVEVTPASASTLNAVATIANSDTLAPLYSGGSTTQFTVTLPANAACSGDTATDGYHVYSYLVPKGTDLSTVTFIGTPSTGYGFVNNVGVYYGAANTAIGTGQIVSIPADFEWGPLVSVDDVPLDTLLYSDSNTSGVWEAGIACANSEGALSDNWNTEVTFDAHAADPNGFIWSAIPGPSGSPFITSADTTTFTEGSPGSFTVTATGSPAPTFGETGALPTGVTLDPTTGVLSGTPTQSGTFPITLTATNGVGSPFVQDFSLDVSAGGAPAITSANNTTFTEGTAGTFTVTATGSPAPTFGETGALPTGVTLNSTSGVLSGTPTQSGAFPLTITATNGIGTPANQSFTLKVDAAPAITSANNTTFTEGSPGSFTVTATGYPTPALGESGALPTGVGFDAATGVLSGTATATGSFPITFTASNGVGTEASLTVSGAPTITSANHTAFVSGTPGSFEVTAVGSPTPTIAESGALPTGVIFDTVTDLLSGTSTANGSYPITFTASNGTLPNAVQSFTLIIGTVPAITSANNTTFTEGSPGTFTVTTTGSPTPTLGEEGALPSGVTFVAATGVLSGTPAASGSFPITLTATNGIGTPATQEFTLTVDAAPDITSPLTTNFYEGVANSFTVTATGYPRPTFAETGALPTGVTLDPTTGVLSGTPNATGTFPITLTASNGITPDATQTFHLVVLVPPLVVTTTSLPGGIVGSVYTATLTASGRAIPFSWSVTSGALPAGLSLDTATGVISGTPTAVGSSTFTVAVRDANGTVASSPLAITVASAVIAPNQGSLAGPVVGIASLPDGKGYWLVNAAGAVSPHGAAVSYGSLAGVTLNAPIAHIVATPDGLGYWLVGSDGGVFAFGNAVYYGSMGGQPLNAPVVALAPTSDGGGYWLVAADGGVFSFGDAVYSGSMGGMHLNRPVVGIAADPATGGYWLVAADGGVFSFDAQFYGSTGGITLNEPVVGIAVSAGGQGYLPVAEDGGIFAFGDSLFSGAAVGIPGSFPIVGMAIDSTTGGYWLASGTGGVYSFNAPFYGAD